MKISADSPYICIQHTYVSICTYANMDENIRDPVRTIAPLEPIVSKDRMFEA